MSSPLLHVALVVSYVLVQVANGVPDPSLSVRVGVQARFQERNKTDPGGGKCPKDGTLKHKKGIVEVTWKWHKEGLCYAGILNIKENWNQASDYCKNLAKLTGIEDEWSTGMAAPADMEYLKEIAIAYGHKNDWENKTSIKPIIITEGRETRPSGPWIAGSDAKTEGKWEWKGIADNLKFDRAEIPNGDFFDDNEGATGKEDCLEIFNDEGYVNDMDCELWEFAFVCEAQKKV